MLPVIIGQSPFLFGHCPAYGRIQDSPLHRAGLSIPIPPGFVLKRPHFDLQGTDGFQTRLYGNIHSRCGISISIPNAQVFFMDSTRTNTF